MSEQIVPSFGRNNCGSRCRVLVHLRDGTVTDVTADPACPDLAPCVRGLQYHKTFLGEDRLLYPLLRTGPRGSGQFKRISWEAALDLAAEQWVRIRDRYGPQSRYVNYAWGVEAALTGLDLAKRLLRLDGGHLDYYGSYSTGATRFVTPYLYGTTETGNSYDQLANSKLIVLWGHNPRQTGFDHQMRWLRQAKNKGVPIVVIDPRRNETARALDARWVGLRPGTDAALADGMAWVILTEDLYDRDFVNRCCQGFTRATMPAGADPADCYFDYLRGTKDGVEKTPEWASDITGVPAAEIAELARLYAGAKPAALLQGYGPQRTRHGEQYVRGGIALACLCGNVGVPGGWAAGTGYCKPYPQPELAQVENPVRAKISVFRWTDAVNDPASVVPQTGLQGAEKLETGIKMIVNLAGNALLNQHGDVERTQAILSDESKCEFILCSDLFMTPSARWADLILPGTSMFEGDNIVAPWTYGEFIGFSNGVIPPLGECRFEFEWLRDLAERLGLREQFDCGCADHRALLQKVYDEYRAAHPELTDLPEYARLKREGIHRFAHKPLVAFAAQRAGTRPFDTPSGRVEIYSPRLAALRDPEVPPIPGYLPARGPAGLPLQLVGWHTLVRTHSVHYNNKTLREMDPQRLWMNPEDARARGIDPAAAVLVRGVHGSTRVPVHITRDVPPGTVALSQGAWYGPDAEGVDQNGCINVLTTLADTPLAHASAQHTAWVEVEQAEG